MPQVAKSASVLKSGLKHQGIFTADYPGIKKREHKEQRQAQFACASFSDGQTKHAPTSYSGQRGGTLRHKAPLISQI